jgi:hypothetical protein
MADKNRPSFFMEPDGTVHMVDIVFVKGNLFRGGIHRLHGGCGGVWYPQRTQDWRAIDKWGPGTKMCPGCDRVRKELVAYFSIPEG